VTTLTLSPSAALAGGDAPAPVLEVRGALKRFGAVTALGGVDLTVQTGEILVLLGASGCGKTTLLRGIAGLTPLDAGEVVLRGRSIGALAPESRDIAMVFQDGALFPHLSAERNIAVGLRPGCDRGRVRAVAELLRIDGLLDRRPSELSGGQRQRVGIARALVRQPGLMLMDEPFAALDAHLRLELRRELRRLHESGELSETVFVTHDQTEALGIADRIAIMRDGTIVQQGTPSELLDHPAELSVARFLGVPRITVLPAWDGIVLAVRPTDLTVGTGAAERLSASIRVSSSEPFAGGWLVSGTTVSGAQLEVVSEWSLAPAVGDTIQVHGDPGRVHAFDQPSGLRTVVTPARVREIWQTLVVGS
jgi:multiple sugar transport system ATP-binding protein